MEMPAALTALALMFGLLLGSFLNVVILRLPPRLEWRWRRDCRELLELADGADPQPPGIVVQRSHCPSCGHTLSAWENIPLLSYALLRGRCRSCGTAISWQYPAVEVITALLVAVCVWQYGVGAPGLLAIAFTGLLVAMSGIDLRTTLLPDQLTYPLLWLGLLASIYSPFGVGPVDAIAGAVAGYLSLWSVYWAFKLLTGKEGMGYGDFKLLAALGAWCGIKALLPIILMSSISGAIIGSLWLALRGRDRATPIPFGPFLAIAGWIQLVLRPDLLGAYMRWAGLA
ncbi:MAG: prepilin peptidase [Gammaproteobacteria bacterium HGW-Gammaproteobacteria-4]|nr:MAG: prepilin peptidase [Gammaproteobacteria bacterium HGW-Gammaproteobacteria-4]